MGVSSSGFLAQIIFIITVIAFMYVLYDVGGYKWAALTILYTTEGRGKRLLFHSFILTVIVCTLCKYYGIILILAPIGYSMLKELNIKNYRVVPVFLIALFFMDILFINRIGFFKNFILHDLFEIITVSILFVLSFGNIAVKDFSLEGLNNPDNYIKDWGIFNLCILAVILMILEFYFGGTYLSAAIFFYLIGIIILYIYRIIGKRNS